MKKVLMLLAAVALLVSCGKDNKDENPADEFAGATYSGTVSVVYKGETVETPNVTIDAMVEENATTMDLLFHQIQFVPAMPAMDVMVPGIPFTIDAAGKVTFGGEDIIPTTYPNPMPVERYKVSGFTGTIEGDKISFSLNFGAIPTSYAGTETK